MEKLNERQKRFCDEYLIDLNATQAAIRAGYSKKSARQIGVENLTKPSIQRYLTDRLESKRSEQIAKQDEILEFLTKGMRGELKEETIVTVGEGEGFSDTKIVEKQIAIKDSIKCAELLGKRYGLYTDKVEQHVDMDLNINIDYGEE